MTIEHLAISGGCVWGLYEYGVLKRLNKEGFWKITDIKSMYTTSAGSIVAAVLAMRMDYDTLDTYLIDRPWSQVWKDSSYHLLDAFRACGLFHKQSFYEIFKPLLNSVDLDINITLKEFYQHTKIDLYIYVTELNSFELIELNYKKYPEWKLVDAIYASCTLPCIFAPIIQYNNCYIDGGIICNYPVKQCFINVEDPNTILGICIDKKTCELTKTEITEDSNLLDFTALLVRKIFKNMMFINDNAGMIKYEICKYAPETTVDELEKMSSSKEERQALIEEGEIDALYYLEKWIGKESIEQS